jgi:hypothetical protein
MCDAWKPTYAYASVVCSVASAACSLSIGFISLAILAVILRSPTKLPSTFSTASFCWAGSSTSTKPKPLDARKGRLPGLPRRTPWMTFADLTVMDRLVKIAARASSSTLNGRLATKMVFWNQVSACESHHEAVPLARLT